MQQPYITRPHAHGQNDRAARLPTPAIHGKALGTGMVALAGRANGKSENAREYRIENAAALDRWHFGLVTGEGRRNVENFVATQFNKAYGARITEFMPDLMGLYDNNALAAACGLRRAATGPMFLEQYLEHPADEILGEKTGTATNRNTMMEVGNLSIARPGYARHLVFWLTMHLRNAGMQWALFSAVPALLNNFRRLGVPLLILAPADPAKVSAEVRATWGTYYDQRPQVSAVDVETAFRALGNA
jgi:hypothetical protein